ncbi:MAG: response regulator transcription factor [Syntrophomonadaceae bacterium]|jgi:ATP/maltotriose-dependent transcriptional regulator MalT
MPLLDSLSNREREVLALLLNGAANQEIASQLCLAESTVKTHLHNIYHKIGVRNRKEAYAKLVYKAKSNPARNVF